MCVFLPCVQEFKKLDKKHSQLRTAMQKKNEKVSSPGVNIIKGMPLFEQCIASLLPSI